LTSCPSLSSWKGVTESLGILLMASSSEKWFWKYSFTFMLHSSLLSQSSEFIQLIENISLYLNNFYISNFSQRCQAHYKVHQWW